MVFKKKLLLALLLSIALLVVVLAFILDYRQSSSSLQALFEVSHGRMLRLSELSANIKDMQRAHRGFVITRQPTFLEPFERATVAIPPLLQELGSDLHTREQAVLKDSLDAKISQKVAYVRLAIDQVKNGRYEDAIAGIGRGKVLMDEINTMISRLRAGEQEFLSRERKRVENRANLVFGVVIAGLLTSSTLLLICLSVIYRDQRRIESLHVQVDEGAQELGSSRKALINTNEELQRANTALKKANAELNDFTYSISHDLKAPLRVISGYCDMLAEDLQERLNDNDKKILKVIIQNTKRMENLISDLLELSRLGNTPLAKGEFDMKEVIDEVLSEKTLPSGSRLKIHPMDGACGDPNLLRQVWENLISNAIKFSSRSELVDIEIGYDRKDSEQVYWIKDAGVGFDPAYTDKLFKVFSRLHGKKEFEGTGAGLAIARKIIEAHGGRIWAESKPESGATFYFALPLNGSGPQMKS